MKRQTRLFYICHINCNVNSVVFYAVDCPKPKNHNNHYYFLDQVIRSSSSKIYEVAKKFLDACSFLYIIISIPPASFTIMTRRINKYTIITPYILFTHISQKPNSTTITQHLKFTPIPQIHTKFILL